MTCSKRGDGSSTANGGSSACAAAPFGYMPSVDRCTAAQRALLKTTKSTGSFIDSETKCAGVGLPNMYAPSPTAQMTVLSGAASFAPSAAPSPQPRPPAGALAKYRHGSRTTISSSTSGYSLTRMVLAPCRELRHAEAYFAVSACGTEAQPWRP